MLLLSCMATKDLRECSILTAKEIAKEALMKKGYFMEDLKISIHETDDLYIVNFSPTDSTQRGNEANFSISKKDCTIVEEKFFQ